MRRIISMILSVVLIATTGLISLTVSATEDISKRITKGATPVTTITTADVKNVDISGNYGNVEECYRILKNYIKTYGSETDTGEKKLVIYSKTEKVNGNEEYKGVLIEPTPTGIHCKALFEQSTLNWQTLEFDLTPNNKTVTSKMAMHMWSSLGPYVGDYSSTFDRSNYTIETNINVAYSQSGAGSVKPDTINGVFRNGLNLTLSIINLFLSQKFNFKSRVLTIGGLGFLDYAEYDDRSFYCDSSSNNHVGGTTLKNKYSASCTSNGYSGDTCCSNCNVVLKKGSSTSALGHKYNSCYDEKCNRCGYYRGVKHTYTNSCDEYCNICGYKRNVSHNYNKTIINPTCTEKGYTEYTCTICGNSYKEDYTDPHHIYDKAVKVDDNLHYHKCTVCQAEETVPHVWDAGVITKAPTFETTGLRERTCKDCGAKKTEVVPVRSAGDLDGDTDIDNKDVEYLLWHTLFPEKYPLDTFADFTGDGVINNKDVEYLLWHTLFPAKYPINKK